MKKRIWISLVILALIFSGCTAKQNVESPNGDTLKIGATPVPHAEILNLIKPILKDQGINLEIVEFTDYVNPNLALSEGELDANFFQHGPYMESFGKEHNVQMVSAGKVHVEPLGLYSKKFKSLDDLADGSIVTIPNDPTNEGRALILLDHQGIIKLKDDAGLEATENDVVENPKNLVFKPIEAAQLPRTLDDVDAAIINTNYALEADLNPTKDALITEGSDSPYANIVTVRPDNQNDEKIKKLMAALQSPEVKEFLEQKYQGSIVPAF